MREMVGYVLDGHSFRIRPAPLERKWMDESDQRFAYRCLPLNIANAHGWEILCTAPFSAIWDGGPGKENIQVETAAGFSPPAMSHFGCGVLTFHIPCVFQTEPGVDLFVTGPLNQAKDGIAALTGVIETDWSPYTFTMNWRFTRPDYRIRFAENEPICHLFPVMRGQLETIVPTVRLLSERADIEREHKLWSESRNAFNAELAQPGSQATQDRWQKNYFRGATPSGQPAPNGHRSRLRLQPFRIQG